MKAFNEKIILKNIKSKDEALSYIKNSIKSYYGIRIDIKDNILKGHQMDFLELLKRNTEKIIFNNNYYYRLLSLYNIVKYNIVGNFSDKEIIVEGIMLVPFYISNNKIYEIYDYELYIASNSINVNEYVLKKTGKKSINDISSDIMEKFNMCYINTNSNCIVKDKLLRYIEYILDCESLRNRIYSIFNEFKTENLFFELY